MSDVEARREARRRKILENSQKRLNKITGVQKRNISYELEGYRTIQNDELNTNLIHRSVPTSDSADNEAFSSGTLSLECLYRNSLLNSSSVSANTQSNHSSLYYFKDYRISIIILIAFLVNVLLCFFSNYDSNYLNKIFIPLLCFEAVDLFYNQKNANKDFKYLILFRTIPQHHLVRIIKYVTLLQTIITDVMTYFFVFVCILYIQSIFANPYISFAL